MATYFDGLNLEHAVRAGTLSIMGFQTAHGRVTMFKLVTVLRRVAPRAAQPCIDIEALPRTSGSQDRAAGLYGIPRLTLVPKLKPYATSPERIRPCG